MGTVAPPAGPPASPPRPRAEVLRRADGVELLGEFEGSGFKEPPHLARRRDGQVVQLSELLYEVTEASDGRRDVDAIAAVVSERTGRPVSAQNVGFLADKRLRPLGVLLLPDGSEPALAKREPLMALRHRRPLLSERAVNAGARLFVWLHHPLVVACVLLAVVAFDVWLFGVHGIAGGLRRVIYEPALLLAVLASVVVATAFHEFGHASACRYGGGRPGVMGVGLYLVWPAFYCDVTDAYRLDRRQRLRTDLGGVYFNGIAALAAGAVYAFTGEEAALFAAVLQHVIVLQQLLPLLRFDGYYVLTDLTGVPDILSRIRPIFRSLIPGREPDPQVTELRPWVRFVVTAYLVTLVPLLAFLFAWMVMGAPRLLATVHDSLGLQLDRIGQAGGPAEAGAGVVRLLALCMPVLATSVSLSRTGRMAGRGLMRWSSGSGRRQAVAAASVLAVGGSLAYVLLPNGDYEPIRPGERGTVGEAVRALPDMPGGRPSFTEAYAAAHAATPTTRQDEAAARAAERRREHPGRQGDEGDGERDAGPDRDVTSPATPGLLRLGDDATGAGGGLTGAGGEAGTESAAPTSPPATATTEAAPAPAPGQESAPAPAPTPGTDGSGTTTTTPAPGSEGPTTGSDATGDPTTTTTTAPSTTEPAAPEAGTTEPPAAESSPAEPPPADTTAITTGDAAAGTTTTAPPATTSTTP